MMSDYLAKPLGVCSAFLLSCSLAMAQKFSVIPLVPATNWQLVSSQVIEVDSVGEFGGEPAVEREYGVKSLESRKYRLGDTIIQVIVEKASDVSSAYGLLTYNQRETMTPEKDMQLTVVSPTGALMVRGRQFVRVLRPAGTELSDSDFRTLLVAIGGTGPSSQDLASLPGALPANGLVPGSVKYLIGLEAARRVLPGFRVDLIGLSEGAEAQVAAYRSGKRRATVLAVTYPTPQMARLEFGAMEKLLQINRGRGPGSLYGKRAGSFVFLVLDSDSELTATSLLSEFRISQQLSWNERYPGDKPIVLQVLELIIANLMFVIMLAGLAMVGGVSIFTFKKIMAKWLPQSAWGRSEEGEIIRLKLG